MAKIVIDAREWSSSTGRYMRGLIPELAKLDRQNNYIVLLKPRDLEKWQQVSDNFKALACPYKEFTFGEQIGYKKQLRALGADLVHFGMVQQPVLYKGDSVTTMNDLTTLRFDNPSKNRVVFRLKQKIYAWLNRKVAKKSAHIITYSEFVKNDIVAYAHINPDRVTSIHLAADPITDAAEPLPALEDRQFIMYIGRPTPHKNLERLIEAYAKLKAQHPELMLVLAGKKDANYERIEASVRRQGIKGIVFTDFVSEGRLRWLYENCSAYVFPSLSEGFGLPGLEAMLHGAAVVSSNATCLPEIYGDAARYFDPQDVQAISDAINEVLTDKNLRQNLIRKGRQQAAKYSWQRTAEQTLEVYKQALSS